MGPGRNFTVKYLCFQVTSPYALLPQHASSTPSAAWDEKTPLFGAFAMMKNASPSLFENSSLHSTGGICHPCPGCRRSPPSDPLAEKGSLVRHMKPAPLDIWTSHSPLSEHEAALNTIDSHRRALVPRPKDLTKWLQLGAEGVIGVRREPGSLGPHCPKHLYKTI